jgi:hypothetical protein
MAHQADEVVRVAAVEVQLDLPQHLNLHPEMLHLARGGAGPRPGRPPAPRGRRRGCWALNVSFRV